MKSNQHRTTVPSVKVVTALRCLALMRRNVHPVARVSLSGGRCSCGGEHSTPTTLSEFSPANEETGSGVELGQGAVGSALRLLGGTGSGNFGHSGREGLVGGSGEGAAKYQKQANTLAGKLEGYVEQYTKDNKPEYAAQAIATAQLLRAGEYQKAYDKLWEGDLRYDIPNTATELVKMKEDAYIDSTFGENWGTKAGTYKVWRSGELDSVRGHFFSIDQKGAQAYSGLHGDAPAVQYEVTVKNPLVADDLTDAYAKLAGVSVSSVRNGRDRAKDVALWWRQKDKAVMRLAMKKGYDAITYVKPAAPALREMVTFRKEDLKRNAAWKPARSALRIRFEKSLRLDPGNVLTTQRAFERDLVGRFQRLKKAIRQLVVVEDCFGLESVPHTLGGTGSGNFGHEGRPGEVGGSGEGGTEQRGERGWLIDRSTGKRIMEATTGLPVKEEWQRNVFVDHTKHMDKQVTLGHTHPDNTGLSDQDIAQLGWGHVRRVEAHLLNGDVVAMEKSENYEWSRATPNKIKEKWNELEDEIFLSEKSKNMSTEEIVLDINRKMAKHFGFTLTITKPLKANKRFAFQTSANKVQGFIGWLEEQNNQGILGITATSDRRQYTGRKAWEQLYIDSAYKKGMVLADRELRKKGITPSSLPPRAVYPVDAFFNAPIHADRVGLIYTRTYSALKGITDAMDARISGTLAQGIADGKSPLELARDMSEDIDSLGIHRAKLIARTEIMRAHNVASINTYREAGVLNVEVQAEWSTAGDGRVCEECGALEGKIFTLDQIENMLPLHPQCRCIALPLITNRVDE